jgi:hypothetical protein
MATLARACPEFPLNRLKRIVWCSAAMTLVPLTVHADPLTTMDEVGAAVMSCWKPPAGVEKSTVTLSFSLKRDGSLVGPPQPTSIDVAGDEKVRQQFVSAAMDAVDRCTPVELSHDLAQGIGGNPFTMEFASSDQAQNLSPSN